MTTFQSAFEWLSAFSSQSTSGGRRNGFSPARRMGVVSMTKNAAVQGAARASAAGMLIANTCCGAGSLHWRCATP